MIADEIKEKQPQAGPFGLTQVKAETSPATSMLKISKGYVGKLFTGDFLEPGLDHAIPRVACSGMPVLTTSDPIFLGCTYVSKSTGATVYARYYAPEMGADAVDDPVAYVMPLGAPIKV